MRRAPLLLVAAVAVGLAGCTPSVPSPTSTITHVASPAATASHADTTIAALEIEGDLPEAVAPGDTFSALNLVATDAQGDPVADYPVTVMVASGDASVPGGAIVVTSDARGVATVTGIVAGASAGPVGLSAAAGAATLELALTIR